MADQKVTDLTELTTPVGTDYAYIVDVSDTTDNAAGSSRKTLLSNLSLGLSWVVTTVTSTTHTVTNETYVLVDDDTAAAAVTVTLPAASGEDGRYIHVKKIGSTATVTVDGNGSETIDGATTATISTQYGSLAMVSNGSNWYIV